MFNPSARAGSIKIPLKFSPEGGFYLFFQPSARNWYCRPSSAPLTPEIRRIACRCGVFAVKSLLDIVLSLIPNYHGDRHSGIKGFMTPAGL
jgi:hypothetical protein